MMEKRKIQIFLFLYLVAVIIAVLYPFDFDFKKHNVRNNARWLKTKNGIQFQQKGQIISKGSTSGLYQTLSRGDGLSLEVWVRPYNIVQDGPARILSYSFDPYLRNFTLAQSKDKLVVRVRTEATDPNGENPHVEVPGIFEANKICHIVFTYDFVRECVYINGKRHECYNTLKGNFSNWDSSFKLLIGNEAFGGRPWFGEIYFAAIYDRALDSGEIQKRYKAGLSENNSSNKNANISNSVPVACYLFNEKEGAELNDTGGSPYKITLNIPENIAAKDTILGISSITVLKRNINAKDLILNILGFIPLGFLMHSLVKLKFQSGKTIFFILIFGLSISLGCEILQHYLPTRNSSIVDILTNLAGLGIGMTVDKFFPQFLNAIGSSLLNIFNSK